MTRRLTLFCLLILGSFMLIGCRASVVSEGPQNDEIGVALPPTIDLTSLPTLPPGEEQPTIDPDSASDTGVEDLQSLPIDITGFEQIALSSPDSVYTGYNCVISEVGCACELPIIQTVDFELIPGDRLLYHFVGEGYEATWEMSRIGPNQYSHTVPFFDDEGVIQGAYFSLLTFTERGYVYNLGAHFNGGEIVTCPDVNFRRISSGE